MGIVRKKSVDSEDRPSSTTSVGSNRRSSSRHNPTPIVISNSKHPPTSSTSKSKITLGSVRASKTERDATPKYVVRNSTSGSTCDASLSTCTFEGYDDMSHFAMSVGDDESFQTPEGRRTRGCGHLDRNPRRFRPGEGGTRLRNRRYPDRIDELNTHQHTAIITDMKQHERKFSQSSESTSPTSNANKRCNSYDASLGNEGDHSALKGLGRMIHDKAAEHLKKGELDSALALFQEILEHQLKFSFEPNSNKSVGATWHNVGVIHMKMGSLNDAYNAMKEAVRIRLASLGATHLDVAASRVNLGSVQLSLKMYSEADISFREALRVRRMVLGGKDGIMHPEIAQVLSHLGLLYYECGEFMAAIGSFEEVLYIQRACQKKHYRNTSDMVSDQQFVRVNLSIAETLVNIGTIRSKRNQYSQACNVLEEAASIQRQQLGENHVTVLRTLDNLAFALSKDGKNDDALKVYKTIIKGQMNKHGVYHVETARTMFKIAVVHEKDVNYLQALECIRQVLAIQERCMDGNENDADAVTLEQEIAQTIKALERLNDINSKRCKE